MAWNRVTFTLEPAAAEALADRLLEAGALAVDCSDAHAGTEHEHALYGEPGVPVEGTWARTLVAALFAAADPWRELLQAALDGAEWPADVAEEAVADADWVQASQRQFEPVCVSARLWVVPSWREPPDPHAINLRLDPGLAFGTGSHPTTLQCLRWLDAHPPAAARVLDYGCGSGILAIAAARLGAAAVTGVDIDPEAVRSAALNARSNGVEGTFLLPEELLPGAYDLVLANILANPLRVLAPLLAGRVRAGGSLVLSGILERQAGELVDCYAPWFDIAVHGSDEGWACLAGVRRADGG